MLHKSEETFFSFFILSIIRVIAASYPSMGSTTGYLRFRELLPSLLIHFFSGILSSSFVFKKGDIANEGSARRFLPTEDEASSELEAVVEEAVAVDILVAAASAVAALGEAVIGEIVDGGVVEGATVAAGDIAEGED